MKSYFIFAIILTAIYVVYYAANIARDLYRKRSQGRTDEEVFEIDPDNGQDSVAVTESETSTVASSLGMIFGISAFEAKTPRAAITATAATTTTTATAPTTIAIWPRTQSIASRTCAPPSLELVPAAAAARRQPPRFYQRKPDRTL